VDEIEIFLQYPMLFQSHLRTTDSTMGLVTGNRNTTTVRHKDGNQHPWNRLMGDTYTWGAAGNTHSAMNDYRARQQSGKVTLREVTVKKEAEDSATVAYKVLVKKQNRVSSAPAPGAYWTNNGGFQNIVKYDSVTMAFLDELDEELAPNMRQFCLDTAGWWVRQGNSTGSGEQHASDADSPVLLIPIDLTPEKAAKLNQRVEKTWQELTHNKLSEYQIRIHEKLRLYKHDVLFTHLYDHPQNSTWTNNPRACTAPIKMKSWVSAKQLELDSLPMNIAGAPVYGSLHQKFDVSMVFSKQQQCQFYAVVRWKKFQFIRNCRIETNQSRNNRFGRRNNSQHRVRENSTVWMPTIEGLVMHNEILYDELGIEKETYVEGTTASPRTLETLSRVRDRTQKRQVRGGYRGAYQGISKITHSGKVTFRVRLQDGLAAIASLDPIKSFHLAGQKRLPMSKEDYLEIQRPMTNVKPIEIGHLEFYRISEPPRKQVTAELLSDMQLPSMPEILLAIDSDIRVTEHEGNYISGENCSGSCDKSESISITIAPGLYVVKRKGKCALGHDPGRAEYNAGFGTLCNEEITIRRLLSQLLVFYDEFRGNMVGQEANVQWSSYDETSSGSLLGRFG